MDIKTDISCNSWSNIDVEDAKTYLHYYSKSMKYALSNFISKIDNPMVLDIGCGNAQLYPILKEKSQNLIYTGIDVSKNLLEVAKNVISEKDTIIENDIYKYAETNKNKFNFSIFCHMIECTESPDFLISKYSDFSDYTAILWYDYPKYEYDVTFINSNPHSREDFKPYIRRKISKNYWNMIIKKNNLELVYNSSSNDNDILEIYKKT